MSSKDRSSSYEDEEDEEDETSEYTDDSDEYTYETDTDEEVPVKQQPQQQQPTTKPPSSATNNVISRPSTTTSVASTRHQLSTRPKVVITSPTDSENTGDSEYTSDSEYTDATDEENEETMVDDQAIRDMKEMFKAFDTDHDGLISPDELGFAMRSYGFDPSQLELEEMISNADLDKNGQVDWKEFKKLISTHYSRLTPQTVLTELHDLFVLFADNSRNGNITTDRFIYVLETLSDRNTKVPLNRSEIVKLTRIADQNNDGEIDYEEFKSVLQRNNSELMNRIVQLLRPSPIDYLSAFHIMPRSFRPSELHQVLNNQGIHIPSNYLKPSLSDNGLAFNVLQIEAKGNALKPNFARIFRLNNMIAKGVPSMNTIDSDVWEMLDRRAYMGLHDGNDYQSNIYYIHAQYSDDKEDEWAFSNNDDIIVRTFCNDPSLYLFIELVIVIRKKGTNTQQYICCGWTKLDIDSSNTKDNKILLPNTFELAIKGGTRTAPAPIDRKDIRVGRRGITGKLALVLKGPSAPQLNMKFTSIVKSEDQKHYCHCPPNFVTSHDSCAILSLYYKILAHDLLNKIQLDYRMKDQENIAMRWFPKLMDDMDVWRGFVLHWNQHLSAVVKKKAKKKKADQQFLIYAREFANVVYMYYPILFSTDLPTIEYGDIVNEQVTQLKQNYVTRYRENMMESMNSDTLFKPFNAKETMYSIYD
jgi:Ca2+-binding EF-hand superfamily protein